MRRFSVILALFVVFLASGDQVYAARSMYDYDPQLMVYHPANIQGLTGLIVTNSAYTLPKGTFTFSLSGVGENSETPDYSLVQGIASLTYGVTDRIEVGVRGKMLVSNVGSSEMRESGMGDTDFLFKWRLTSQGEYLPAFALGVGVTIPTADETKGYSEVGHEGVRLMVIGAHEMEMPDGIVLGFYGEGQIVLVDQLEEEGSSEYQEQYGVINLGVLFPVTENNQWQVIAEFNSVTKKDIATLGETDYTAFMPGLRYVTPTLNMTAGVQFLNKDLPDVKNDLRYIATLGLLF